VVYIFGDGRKADTCFGEQPHRNFYLRCWSGYALTRQLALPSRSLRRGQKVQVRCEYFPVPKPLPAATDDDTAPGARPDTDESQDTEPTSWSYRAVLMGIGSPLPFVPTGLRRRWAVQHAVETVLDAAYHDPTDPDATSDPKVRVRVDGGVARVSYLPPGKTDASDTIDLEPIPIALVSG
jgi:hypothetical protein